jgi:hypothetical protein
MPIFSNFKLAYEPLRIPIFTYQHCTTLRNVKQRRVNTRSPARSTHYINIKTPISKYNYTNLNTTSFSAVCASHHSYAPCAALLILRSTAQHYAALRTTTQHYAPPHSTAQHYAALRTTTRHYAPPHSTTQHYATRPQPRTSPVFIQFTITFPLLCLSFLHPASILFFVDCKIARAAHKSAWGNNIQHKRRETHETRFSRPIFRKSINRENFWGAYL